MKVKKGFTLIELLAVIVILAVIALITTPLVLHNIESSKKSGAKTSGNEYIKAFEGSIVNIMEEDIDKAAGLFVINDKGNVVIHNTDYAISIKGTKPTDGKICVSSEGDVTKAYLKVNGYIVSYDGEKTELTDLKEIGNIDCDAVDDNAILILKGATSTTKSITIPYIVSNTVSGIQSISCMYGTTDEYENSVKGTANECILNNLKNNTKYYYKVIAINIDGVLTEKKGEITTKNFNAIDITENSTKWTTSKTVTISGSTSGATLEYRVQRYSFAQGKYIISDWAPYNKPFVLSAAAIKDYPTTVYARFNDGVNTSSETTLAITTIDTSAPGLVLGSINKTTNNITIPFTAYDNESGIKSTTCVYGTSTSYGSNGTISNNSCVMNNIKSGTTYYYKITTTNNAGLSKEVSGNTASGTFGAITITQTPSSWSTSKTITITGATTGASLQYQLGGTSGTWTTISSGGTIKLTNNTTIYARLWDGVNASATKTLTITTIDTTAPSLTTGTVSKTTNSITVPYTAYDNESKIKSTTCVYGTSTSYGSTGTISNNSCVMNNIKSGTTYYYKITTTNNAGLSKEVSGNTASGTFGAITITQTPSSWSTSKTITITGATTGATLQYQLGGTSGTWTTISSGGTIKLTNNTTIYARLWDGVNASATKTLTITTIDTTSPTIASFTYTTTTNSIKVTASATDAESGIYGYQFSKDNGSTWTTIQTGNVYTFTSLTSGSYNIKVRAYNGTYSTGGRLYKDSAATSVSTTSINQAITISAPSACSKTKTVTVSASVPSGASLQYQLGGTSGTWTNISSGGTFTVSSNTTIYARLWDGKNASATKTLSVTTIDTIKPSTIAPTVTNITTATSTTNTIFVTNNQTDACGLNTGTLRYGISTSASGTYTWQSSSTFTGLANNTTYYVKTRVNDIAGNGLTESAVTTIKTGTAFKAPTLSINTTDWAKSKVVTIKYTSGDTYYFKSTVVATSSIEVIPCGNGSSPGTCQPTKDCSTATQSATCSNSTKNISANTWYKTENATIYLTYTANGTVTATSMIGSTSSSSSLTVSKIDNSGPILSNLNNGSGGNWTNSNFSVSYSVSETQSGWDHCEYKYAYDVYSSCQNNWCRDDGTFSNNTFTASFSGERNTTAYFRCYDKLGNVSNTLSTPIKIDRTGPTLSVGSTEDYWDPDNNYSCGTSVTYNGSVSDSGSGVVDVYSKDGDGTVYRDFAWGSSFSDTWRGLGNRGLITYCATDAAGNTTCYVGHNTTIVEDACECDNSCYDPAYCDVYHNGPNAGYSCTNTVWACSYRVSNAGETSYKDCENWGGTIKTSSDGYHLSHDSYWTDGAYLPAYCVVAQNTDGLHSVFCTNNTNQWYESGGSGESTCSIEYIKPYDYCDDCDTSGISDCNGSPTTCEANISC